MVEIKPFGSSKKWLFDQFSKLELLMGCSDTLKMQNKIEKVNTKKTT